METNRQKMSKTLDIEIIHLSTDHNKKLLAPKNVSKKTEQINVDPIERLKKQFKHHLLKCLEDEVQEVLKMDVITIEDKTPNFRYYYEEKQVYRFKTGLVFTQISKTLLKKCLTKICRNECFSSTRFAIIDKTRNWWKYLSANERINTRLRIRKINSFSFGTLIDLSNFVEHYSSTKELPTKNVAKDDIIADFQLDEKTLEVIFRLTSGGVDKKHTKNIRYKLEYEYKSINSVTFSVEEKAIRLYLTLSTPPLLFKVAIDDMDSAQRTDDCRKKARYDPRFPPRKQKIYKDLELENGVHTYDIQNNEIWIRDNCFDGCPKEVIGMCNVLSLELPLIQNISRAQKDGHDLSDPYRLLGLIKRFTRIPIYFGLIERQDCPSVKFGHFLRQFSKELKPLKPNEFSIQYAFNSVFSLNNLPFDELVFKSQTNQFIDNVINYSKEDPKAIEETLFELFAINDRSAIFSTMNALNFIYEDLKERNKKFKKEENQELVNIRRCILTPTRFLMLAPQLTLKSRFIENSDPEYTIRLSIREDNLQSLQFSVGNLKLNTDGILQRMIKEPLSDGIQIGGRLYDFLGSSSSQLRDTGLILYAKDSENRTVESIIESIGDLSEFKRNVPKYVARLGLAFSQVMTHIEVSKNQTKVEEDIERIGFDGEGNEQKYNFSDGIGRVSMDVMEKVYEKLKIECKHKPIAMQIRYGGCKGMLVVDPNLKDKKIVFRKSMRKYDSDESKLGVIKLSSPRPLYLNRPLITILDQLGIDDKVFLKLLLNELKDLSNSMVCECNASKILQSSTTLGISYLKLFKSKIPFLSEPLFRQIIDSVINHRINELKIKGRIKLPMSSARTVFGVLDETETLEYGEVFVQLSKVDEDNMPFEGTDNTVILEGEIMVTKFPCLHPGDVRKLKAVDVKGLHHIKDCIVFPQKGNRPHSDEMAGSDLDGDEYAVIWNSPLIFSNENHKPMDFPSAAAQELDKDLTREDIIDFYCNFIVNNNVGLIASAHLARADNWSTDDTEPNGIFSEVCMSLAKKYSVSLDFAKTGRVEAIKWFERPFIYPDFMEKFAEKRTRISRHILGQLYRHCDRISLGMHSNKNNELTATPNERLGWPLNEEPEGMTEYLESAKIRYEDYKSNIEHLLNRFGVDSEAILLSGTFSRISKYMSGRSETNDVHELLENMVNKVFIRFKKLFESDSENDSKEQKEKRVRAWYMTPFLIETQIKDRYFGFSWTITDHLCDLFKSHQISTSVEHKCFEFSSKLFDDFFEDNYLYVEPNFDESLNLSESDKRQTIMEERCKTTEVVIRAWLERQDHLFFKRYIKKRLISSKDYVISDMDRKLRKKLMQIRIEVLGMARDTEQPLKTVGSLLMEFFMQCIIEWFSVESLDDNNRVVDTPLIKLGFSAFITLNHFYKTRDISHIIDLGSNFRISLEAIIRDEVFYIVLPTPQNSDPKLEKFTEFMVQKPEVFAENLMRISGAIQVHLEPYPIRTKSLKYYYLLTVTGTVWSLQMIKNFVCHPSFRKIVAFHEKWRRPNLRYKSDPSFA